MLSCLLDESAGRFVHSLSAQVKGAGFAEPLSGQRECAAVLDGGQLVTNRAIGLAGIRDPANPSGTHEDAGIRVVVPLSDGVELVIVAAWTPQSSPESSC